MTHSEVRQQVIITLRSAQSRTATFLGRSFRVVPAVLVRSQVLNNNLGASYLPADEFTPEWAYVWNGIPVLVGEHPSLRGESVSARTPELWDARMVGFIFNARVERDGQKARLLAEVWLDESRADTVVGMQAVLDRLAAGTPVELSTGFLCNVTQQSGAFDGRAFELVMRPAGADHLVISTEMTGACSVRDGCGLGVNKEKPSMSEPREGWRGILDRAGELLTARKTKTVVQFTPAEQWEQNVSLAMAREFEARHEDYMSDSDRSNLLRVGLQEKFGASFHGEVVVCDVFSDAKEVVFWVMTAIGPEPPGPEYFRVEYSEGEGGALEFSELKKVRRQMTYQPVAQSADPAANAAPLVATNAGKPCGCAEDEPMSGTNNEGLEQSVKALVETVGNLAGTVKALSDDVKAIKDAANSDPNPAIAGLKATIGQLAASVESMQTVTKTAVQERERERRGLVAALVGNYRVPFNEAELEAKSLDELRKIQQMAQPTDNSGRGAPRGALSREDQAFAEPVPYFKKSEGK